MEITQCLCSRLTPDSGRNVPERDAAARACARAFRGILVFAGHLGGLQMEIYGIVAIFRLNTLREIAKSNNLFPHSDVLRV